MKIRTSYFYQIRNFNRNMIPMSTAVWDPSWFHANQGPNHIFYDARKILNGTRLNPIINAGIKCGEQEPHPCPCEEKDYFRCSFLRNYRKNLEEIDFDKMIADLQAFAQTYQEKHQIEEEIIIVLIVYEAPGNMCSERAPLQEYFTAHGWECKELDYPINNLASIKHLPFDF
jgi:hypothetical protein